MDKQRARQLYELADRLSKLDVNTLSEEQLSHRNTMIAKLQEEVTTIKEMASKIISVDDKHGFITVIVQAPDGSKRAMANDNPNYIQKWLQKYGLTLPQSITSQFVGVHEEFNGEYDDEAGMAKSNLRTMARAVNGLLDTIEDNDNLPEWAQEKIAKAEMMTTSVWDYLLSQKEQGMDPKVQGMSEGSQRVDSLVTDALKIMRGSDYQVDAVKAIKTVLGDREYNSRRGFYSFYVKQLMDMHGQEGIAEAGFPGAPDVEMPPMKPSGDPQRDKLKQEYMDLHREIKSLVDIPYRSDSSPEQKMQAKARIKQLNDRADQIKAILEPRQPPNEWQKKTYGYDDNWNRVGKGIAETKKPSPKLTPVNIKKTDTVSEEINTEAYERLQKVFAFKNYES